MQRRALGSNGLDVPAIGLGCVGMSDLYGACDPDASVATIRRALELGVDHFDSSDVYGAGHNEELLGATLAGRRDDVVLATKFHAAMGEDPNAQGNSRRWIVREVENSLRRLRTDHIDLYQVHRPDPSTDIDDTLSALTDLVHAGKIRYFGCSTFPAEEIVEAHWVSERRGLERFRTEQPPYSIFVRGIERDVLPVCERYGMGVLVWSPLNGSWLTGRYRLGGEAPSGGRAQRMPARFDTSRPENQRKLELVEELSKVAADAGLPLTHLAQAFVLAHPAVTSAIIGPRTPEQLDDLLAAADVRLDDDVLDRIDELVPPGTNVNPADEGYVAPAVRSAWRRRRPSTAR
jgi:aryl-alcohol dehydrogenase-like predicted oxidoreductase